MTLATHYNYTSLVLIDKLHELQELKIITHIYIVQFIATHPK
jgi:hypothetical protein